MRKLDIGCGGSEKFKIHMVTGDVNCDILKPLYKVPNFVQCDAHHLPFKDNYFNRVTLFHLIEHLENPSKALREARRALEENGVLDLATPNALYLVKIIRALWRGTYSPHRDHIATWGKPELKKLLSQAGFNSSIKYETYRDIEKPWYYKLLIKICPFPAIKHRQLRAIAKIDEKRGPST